MIIELGTEKDIESWMNLVEAVDVEHRRQHVAEKMVLYMLSKMDTHSDISVSTYREGGA